MNDDHILRVGIAGLGGASRKILPSFNAAAGIALAAAADIRTEARAEFQAVYGLPAYASVDELCRAADLDVIYVATPNPFHCEHAVMAASAGKHVICEKPMAVSLEECDRMIEAASRSGVQLLQGQSKLFDRPVIAMRDVIQSGALGRVIQLDSWNFNDWMKRPRLPSELDTTRGGGVVFRQGPIQTEIARYLIGTTPRSVRAVSGRWSKGLPTEGNYAALIEFEDNKVASLSFNGYGYFGIGELLPDQNRAESDCSASFLNKRTKPEAPATSGEKYAGLQALSTLRDRPMDAFTPYPGLIIVSCEYGVIRQSENGLYVYTPGGCEEIPVPRSRGRAAALMELRAAVQEGRIARPDGHWGKATVEVCLAMLESSRTGQTVTLHHQNHQFSSPPCAGIS